MGAAGGSGEVSLSAAAQQMLNLINGARSQAGLAPLAVDPTLQALALKKAEDMVTYAYFAHDSPRLGWPAQMEQAAGYLAPAMGAEDMAEAASVPYAFVMFRGSPTHWANIMDPAFTRIGIAVLPITGGVLVEILFSGTPVAGG